MSLLGKVGTAAVLVAVAAVALHYKDGASADEGGGGGGPGVADIPGDYLRAYRAAGETCPALDWALLAGIGKVETNHGRLKAAGVRSGANFAGAKGPMQFLTPTFNSVRSRHSGIGSDIYDPGDAIPAAAHYLCDSGLSQGDQYRAIYAYNHAGWYVAKVQNQAAAYRRAG
ncbi:lytic transglycosylase domain-containing protein [Amycolatopsis minnesotensis]|uniref:Transglycosylase SLT domain-containing protein n=1 Tax=Amycolatopsis minnesotensis TaxID=337894 RepID=A0ABN2SGV2_9PSEU